MKVHKVTGGQTLYRFFCLGCEESHGPTASWEFNGDFEHPTFRPSILVQGTKLTPKGEAEYARRREAGFPPNDEPLDHIKTVCHSYVTDGRIQYLNDCTHPLVGQTVELPDIDI